MSTIIEQLRHYFDNTPRDVIEKEWYDLGLPYEGVSPTVEEFLISLNDTKWGYVLKEVKSVNLYEDPSNYSDFFYTFA